ncbi:DUF885 domain-containing protein [Glycomyces algeriensis]|uniref:DUF885 domain-containing protein n=1 Tax=Glycomyces algeriensis TaxID=256037 RepID=A0A9W6LH26_9ACTN|nr:DUF885 domain-containing protein [Glycomyces algeriensis]MDA1367980.1 DUF885 domain-containing protein [Glycomyces algeriensis]MDR7349519.1 uncharacterized protein (DUF885 family) [Glycomyces algeriensis]GLI42226.1 hypothetical protein GALLR39Z86_20760 [Glycomyces algeriensis]
MGDPQLAALAQRYFDFHLADNPTSASFYGIAGYDDKLPDPSRDGDRARLAHQAEIRTGLDAIDARVLEGQDRITYSMLARLTADQSASIEAALGEVGLSNTITGPVSTMLSSLPRMSLNSEQRSRDYLVRLGSLGGYFDAVLDRYRQAAAEGRHQTRRGVLAVIEQIDDYLGTDLESDPLVGPTPTGVDGWKEQAVALVAERVRPSLQRWREALETEFLPVSRGDDEVGVCHVPGGLEGYAAASRQFTTTDLTPEEVHRIGLEEVERLRGEFAEIGARALGTADVAEVVDRLRNDRSLRYASSDEILADVTEALRRAEAALPKAFLDYDIAPCSVEVIPEAAAKGSTLAYYTVPAADGSRPGTHWVNTYEPESRARYEYEALAFHESVPGHHLQFALGQTLEGLPQFRRFAYVTAFGEGWGLYTERLCDEIGLYSGDLQRLGMVSFDAWRACRLVVDTGMHVFGWSRERAVAYMRENTALSEANIANEVDRYIAWPGQALAYMVGRRHIGALRERAREALGEAFDLRHFHDRVLSNGSIPLETMTAVVEDWIAESA